MAVVAINADDKNTTLVDFIIQNIRKKILNENLFLTLIYPNQVLIKFFFSNEKIHF